MKGMKGFLVILVSLLLGNFITAFTKLPIPGSILGMLILFILLSKKVVKVETVDPAAGLLISIMMILFIPGIVNLMNVYEKFQGVIPQLIIIVVGTTLLIMATTSIVADRIIKAKNKDNKNDV